MMMNFKQLTTYKVRSEKRKRQEKLAKMQQKNENNWCDFD